METSSQAKINIIETEPFKNVLKHNFLDDLHIFRFDNGNLDEFKIYERIKQEAREPFNVRVVK